MTNNPLNGYQPEYADAIADAQEHNIEHAKASQGGGSPDSLTLPTCRFCGRQVLPVDKYADAEAAKKRERRRVKGLYNLTVEIPRDVAERVFAPEALRKLGYLSKSDFVRQAVAALDARLSTIEAKEKADSAGTPNGNK